MADLRGSRKNISLAIFLGLVLFLCLTAVVWPLMVQSQLRTKINGLQGTLSTQRAIIASKPYSQKQYDALVRRSSTEGALLRGATRPQAEIDAQARIKSIVESNNVKLLQTQSKSSTSDDSFTEIVTSVQLECGHRQLNDILYDIEFGSTKFSIGRMDIRTQRIRPSASANARSQDPALTQLRVALDITGYWRADTQGQ